MYWQAYIMEYNTLNCQMHPNASQQILYYIVQIHVMYSTVQLLLVLSKL